MTDRHPARAALAAAGLLLACTVDRAIVHQQVYGCDPTAKDPGCGTDPQGGPLMCFAGRPLGGADFCAERCADPAAAPAGSVCSQSGARLTACDPGTPDSCNNRKLGCFRNNVLADGGVCVTITPCSSDSDCPDPVRSRCATALIDEQYETPASFKSDHLWCLQADCQRRRTACSPGDTCLRDVAPPGTDAPDICVPSCDSQLRCPPAHFCLRKVSGAGSPTVCIPGLMGFRCDSTLDCMMGECTDFGVFFKLCSVPCADDSQCTKYDGKQGRFYCNADHHCTTPEAFRGSPCSKDSDCLGGLTCARLTGDPADGGNCVTPCDASGKCAPRGGVPHTCLSFPGGKGLRGCYPGYFELPCTSDDQCLPGLSCRQVAPDRPSICTSLCASDDDCTRIRWSKKGTCQSLPAMGIKVCLTPPRPTTGAPP
jgi:hypothetical protein